MTTKVAATAAPAATGETTTIASSSRDIWQMSPKRNVAQSLQPTPSTTPGQSLHIFGKVIYCTASRHTHTHTHSHTLTCKLKVHQMGVTKAKVNRQQSSQRFVIHPPPPQPLCESACESVESAVGSPSTSRLPACPSPSIAFLPTVPAERRFLWQIVSVVVIFKLKNC